MDEAPETLGSAYEDSDFRVDTSEYPNHPEGVTMRTSSSSIHVVNLLNIAERNRIIESWKILGDLIMVRGTDGIVYVRPDALDRLIEKLRTDR